MVFNGNPNYPVKNNMPALVIKQIVELIHKHSITCIWEQSYKCPCVDITTGQPKSDCQVCNGQGWLYLHPRNVDIALQSDKNNFTLTSNGSDRLGSTLATPQITVNGYEQGIKPGDRITVPGWTTNETYTFNVNQSRLNNGIFVPYKVEKINEAIVLNSDKTDIEYINDDRITLKDNFVSINDEDLLNKTISLSLEITKRFYVVSMLKELRYQKYERLDDKRWATGLRVEPNEEEPIENYEYPNFEQVVSRDGAVIKIGEDQIYRMPPQLLLRRENLYFSNLNLVTSEVGNNTQVKDPRESEFDDFLGND